jgi:dipeptidase E
MESARRVLLISNSTVHGRGYLDHASQEIVRLLGRARMVLFFPFALFDHDAYAVKAKRRFAGMGFQLESIHSANDPQQAIADADALFIGGGNTFRLLKALQDLELIEPIRGKVCNGTPYIGSSAGSNVAGLTIKTTNDMPIVQPSSFDALGLVSFQINPHFQDPELNSTQMGETREERILQFLEENDTPVVGLREGAWIMGENERAWLGGANGARVFRRGEAPVEMVTGADLTELVRAG